MRARRRGEAQRRAGQRRQVGARGDGARHAGAAARRADSRPGAVRHARSRTRCLKMAERVVSDGDERGGEVARTTRPREAARDLLAAWLASVGLRGEGPAALIEPDAGATTSATRSSPGAPAASTSAGCGAAVDEARRSRDRRATATRRPRGGLFEACVPAVPYVPATAFLGREKAKLAGARRRAAPGRAGRRRRSGRCTGSPTRSSGSASTGFPASRSR